MKLALVYDRVNKFGGAERVLLALHEIWPQAPLYSAVYDPQKAAWARVFRVKPSFMQYLPLARSHHELFPWLTPLAFESLDFTGFDVVLSVTSAEAKGILTKPETLHICYCLTPTRYLWSGFSAYQDYPGWGQWSGLARVALSWLGPKLQEWDLIAASRPDFYLAISNQVAARIKKYYQRQVEAIIYPPVDLDKFKMKSEKLKVKHQDSYFLLVSRLVGYKRVDLVVRAFNKLGWPLVIVGDGWQKSELEKRARRNIIFAGGDLTDEELVGYYQNCRAFVYAAEEDFGLAAVEAQAAGKPVIAFGQSGSAETVIAGKTGLFFARQEVNDLVRTLAAFVKMRFREAACRASAERFDKSNFQNNMRQSVERLFSEYAKRRI